MPQSQQRRGIWTAPSRQCSPTEHWQCSGYVSALNKGKTGPEHPDAKQAKEARGEIEALWRAVKPLTEKARAAK